MSGRADAAHYETGWNSAVELASWLRSGGALPTSRSSLVLQQGEVLHCQVEVELAGFWSQDTSYTSDAMVFGATWKGLAATAGASMLWNSRQRRKAEAEGLAQWRGLGNGLVSVTSHRLFFPADGQMLWWSMDGGIISFEPIWSQYLAVIHGENSAPISVRGPAVPYLSVLLNYLLFDEVPSLTES